MPDMRSEHDPRSRAAEEPPVDVDALLDAAAGLPFDAPEAEGDEPRSSPALPATLPPELAAAVREALAAPRTLPPGPGEGSAVIRCPGCGALDTVRVGDPPRPSPCGRCGTPLDPAAPFEVHLDDLEAVIEGTEVTLLLLLARRGGGVWWLGDAMRPALTSGRGTFVVARLDLARFPQAPLRLGLPRGPALVFCQGGVQLGHIVFPAIAEAVGRFMGQAIGPWVTGAAARGLGGVAPVLPAPQAQGGEDESDGGEGDGRG